MRENAASISLPKSLADWRGSKIYVKNAAHGIAMVAELDDTAGEVYNLMENDGKENWSFGRGEIQTPPHLAGL